MAWDDTKSAGDLIKSADWNDMVDFIKYDSIFKVAQYYDRFLYFPCSYTDNWETYTSGSGSVTLAFMIWYISTGTTSSSVARFNLNSQQISFGKSTTFARLGQQIYTGMLSGNATGFIGICTSKLTSLDSATLTDEHVGILFNDGVWYASVSNGSTQQKTDISSSVPSSMFFLEMKRNKTEDIVFYINNTQVASFSLAEDSSGGSIYGYYQFFVNNKSLTDDVRLYLYNILYEYK